MAPSIKRVFLTDGDDAGTSVALRATHMVSSQVGVQMTVEGAWSRNNDLSTAAHNFGAWSDHRIGILDASLVWQPVRFESEQWAHGPRIHAGPSVHVRRVEQPVSLYHPAALNQPGAREDILQHSRYDHAYEGVVEGPSGAEGEYLLLTRDDDGTSVGGVLGLSYGVSYQQFTVRLMGVARSYPAKYGMLYGWGLDVGVRL